MQTILNASCAMRILIQSTLLGSLAIAEDNKAIVQLFFEGEKLPLRYETGESALLNEAFKQLHAYLAGKQKCFFLPLHPKGTPFMRAVWEKLLTIPYGSTMSYGALAAQLGKPTAARAVGMANNRNPLPIFIPCHRVVGSNGNLVGYRGGITIKEQLLTLERRTL